MSDIFYPDTLKEHIKRVPLVDERNWRVVWDEGIIYGPERDELHLLFLFHSLNHFLLIYPFGWTNIHLFEGFLAFGYSRQVLHHNCIPFSLFQSQLFQVHPPSFIILDRVMTPILFLSVGILFHGILCDDTLILLCLFQHINAKSLEIRQVQLVERLEVHTIVVDYVYVL